MRESPIHSPPCPSFAPNLLLSSCASLTLRSVYKIACLASLGAVAAGSIELSTNDLTKTGRSLDNIKAKWSQSLSVLGNDVRLHVMR